MQNEKKKSVEETKRDLEASRIRFERVSQRVGLPENYQGEWKPKKIDNQDSLNIAVFGE